MIYRYMPSLTLKTLCTAFSVAMGATVASAHGWYDPMCCSDKDCHPINSCEELVEQKDGTVKWGEYTFTKDKEKPSHDSKCHVCIYNGTPLCFYTLQGA